MATVSFFVPTNMASPPSLTGTITVTSATSTQITLTNGLNTDILFGSFTYSGTNVFGTLTGFETFAGSTLTSEATGLSIDTTVAESYLLNNQAQGLLQLALPGHDIINGSSGNDVLIGYNGNDVFTGGGGNDTIQGGGTNNTAVYSGTAAQYSISISGSTFTVADTVPNRDGTDTLFNIQYAQFSDRTIALTIVPPTSVQQEVFGLYAALYGRAAEFPGYSYWVGLVGQQSDGAGVTLANASSTAVTLNDAQVLGQGFVNTQNTYFNQIYGSLSDSDFINAMYVNIGGNAGDPSGIAYWTNLLQQAETGGQSVQAARAGLVGQFVHDLVDVNLSTVTSLTSAQYQAALQRQETINNKIAVSLAYSNASQGSGGMILDPHSVGDAAYNAATTILQNVTYDPATVTAAILGINNAVAHQDLTLI